MSPIVSLILDLLIAGLLVATIVYAIQLNRQLIQMRESRGEMEGLIQDFNEATSRAETGIKTMRRAAIETGEGLQKSVERAQTLRDELQFLVETAEALARRLADAPATARGVSPSAAAPPRRPQASQPGAGEAPCSPRDRAHELLRVMAQEQGRGQGGDSARGRAPAVRDEQGPTRAPRLPNLDESQDLPRGRGALTRGEPASSRSARLADLLDTSQDLPRGRGVLTRGDVGRPEPSTRSEGGRADPGRGTLPELARGDRRAPEPPRRESGDGMSRAERELLQAIESRR